MSLQSELSDVAFSLNPEKSQIIERASEHIFQLEKLLKSYVKAGGDLYADNPEWDRLAALAKPLLDSSDAAGEAK
jgi:hypothetical protein